jgi:uroporphyrinogen decarboxylase
VSTSLTSRDIVRRTLEFASPPRIPRHLWLLPWATDHYPEEVKRIRARFPDDIVTSPRCNTVPLLTQGDPYAAGEFVDEWGCKFQNLQDGIIGVVKEPPIPTWDRVDDLRIPKERLSVDGEAVRDFCGATDCFVISAGAPRPFERLQFLRGTENLFMDLARPSSELRDLIERLHTFYMEELTLWAKTSVDALMIMDDWGAQDAMLISPKTWRELFKPLYKDYIDLAHHHGKYVFMHSDGHILDILPDLLDLGLDAINSQVWCMGVETLGERFAGRITFWGELDRQELLPRGSTEDVAEAARSMTRELYRSGGLIAQCEFGPGAKPENVFAAFETWEAADV